MRGIVRAPVTPSAPAREAFDTSTIFTRIVRWHGQCCIRQTNNGGVPVVADDGELVGIVSSSDILRVFLVSQELMNG